MALLIAAVLSVGALLGCESGHNTTPPAPRTYTITVTVNSGALARSTSLMLTVQ